MTTATDMVRPTMTERRIGLPRETTTQYLLTVRYGDEEGWVREVDTSFVKLARRVTELLFSGLYPLVFTFSIMYDAEAYEPEEVSRPRIKTPEPNQAIEYTSMCLETGEIKCCYDALELIRQIGRDLKEWKGELRTWQLTADPTGKPSGPLQEPPEAEKTYTLEVTILIRQKVTKAALLAGETVRDIQRQIPAELEQHVTQIKVKDGRKLIQSRTYVEVK
jgi:hypothetical protein